MTVNSGGDPLLKRLVRLGPVSLLIFFFLFVFHHASVAGNGLSLQSEEGDFSLRATLGGSTGSDQQTIS